MTIFSHTLVIGDQSFLFSFSEVRRIDSSKFYVSVKDNNQSVVAFEMKKELYKDNWVVCQPAPDWIRQKEAIFSNWINRNLSGQRRYELKAYA